jgi:hypothetical protein
MSAPLTETLREAISLSEAVDFLPRRPNVSTLWRWATKGTRGVKLETWIVGGVRCTTPAALEKFLQRLNADHLEEDVDGDNSDFARRGKEASKALEALGC